MKINKHRRLSKIIQILERWAPIESSEVSQHLADIFGVDEGEIKRNVVNDLKFLRDEGEVTPLFFDKHGQFISREIEPDATFYRVKWQLKSLEDQWISGSQELIKFESFIEADEYLRDKVSVRQGLGPDLKQESSDFHTLYFEINHEIYHLRLPRLPQRHGDLPILGLALCRSRSSYPNGLKEDFEILNKSYPNIPFILMSFNEPFLSSFELDAPLTFLFSHDHRVTFLNEINKNPVEYLEIPFSQANNLLSYLTFFRDKTQTRHWTEVKKEQGKDYQTGDREGLTLPLLFRLKPTSGFLLK